MFCKEPSSSNLEHIHCDLYCSNPMPSASDHIGSVYFAEHWFCSTSECVAASVLWMLTVSKSGIGMDSGFGHLTAMTLSTKHGYRVIATCLKQESVDDFLSNAAFTANRSTATTMNVTKLEDIERGKQFTMKYLDSTGSVLWGIVNNAGFSIVGQFEVVPPSFDELERNALYEAPRNIARFILSDFISFYLEI